MDYCHSTFGHDICMTFIGQTDKILERLFLSDKSLSDEKIVVKGNSLNPDFFGQRKGVSSVFICTFVGWSGAGGCGELKGGYW